MKTRKETRMTRRIYYNDHVRRERNRFNATGHGDTPGTIWITDEDRYKLLRDDMFPYKNMLVSPSCSIRRNDKREIEVGINVANATRTFHRLFIDLCGVKALSVEIDYSSFIN